MILSSVTIVSSGDEVREQRDRLARLAKAHLIAQEDAALPPLDGGGDALALKG